MGHLDKAVKTIITVVINITHTSFLYNYQMSIIYMLLLL